VTAFYSEVVAAVVVSLPRRIGDREIAGAVITPRVCKSTFVNELTSTITFL